VEYLREDSKHITDNMQHYDPFPDHITAEFFLQAKNNQGGIFSVLRLLFFILDKHIIKAQDRTCYGAIESALLDIWGQCAGLALYKLVGISIDNNELKSFFTVSLNSDLNVIRSETQRGLEWTPYLKLKVNDSIDLSRSILEVVLETLENSGKKYLISLDANASWTPQISLDYLELLVPIKDKIFMVEQPFPVGIIENIDEWIKIKEIYENNGLLIYADESVCTYEDIEPLTPVCHGVNVKLDKTGGIRNALRLIKEANNKHLKLWLGIMVSSQLSVTTTSHLLPLSGVGDLDGSLLITKESNPFLGGCKISNGHVTLSSSNGIGVSFNK